MRGIDSVYDSYIRIIEKLGRRCMNNKRYMQKLKPMQLY